MTNWRDDFSGWLEDTGRAEKTVDAYLSDVNGYARWVAALSGEFVPAMLNAPDLRDYRAHALDEEHVSANTWNRRWASLKVFCAWALESGHVASDPFVGVRKVSDEELPPYWLEESEFRALRRLVETRVNQANTESKMKRALRNRAAFALMVYAGFRVGDVVRIRASDLLLRDRSGTAKVLGKGDKPATLPLAREARIALQAWMDVHDDDDLFDVSARQWQRIFEGLGQRVGIDEMTPHRLRHTFAKRLLNTGKPIGVVKKLMRHNDRRTTERYLQPSRGELQAAVENL